MPEIVSAPEFGGVANIDWWRNVCLAEVNAYLETLTAQERVVWALENLPGTHAVSSSFGIQAAVMLHLVTISQQRCPWS